MENWIWGAVAVALVVLAKTVWDFVRSPRDGVEAGTTEEAIIHAPEGLRVVSRAERRELARKGVSLAVVPAATAPDAAGHSVSVLDAMPANEEMDTVRLVVPARSGAETSGNVISLELRKKAVPEDTIIGAEDDFVDPLALSQSQSRVVEAQDYVIVYVVPSHVPFDGERLLKCALSYGLRFGEMSMFHRHEHPSGHGEVLFSMARADEVGAFDLESMTGEFIPALTLFMALPSQQPALAYDMMIDTARRIASELHGEVLDQNQNPLNRQLVEHYREDVLEYTRRQLMGVAVAV
ncbi:MAG TPA: cell division protein ZipA [Fluviicoccus sp.]|nr:cell division protein ZipA [Fluviicoccus sp.]